tara:strand:+ start:41544 stop:42404 length:861 start_codon:yes stop_codon:yes gene_type:complete
VLTLLLTLIACTDEQASSVGEPSAGKEPSADREPSAGKEPSASKEPSAYQEPSANRIYEPLPDFTQYKDVKKKKSAFFDFMHPRVKAANDAVWEERLRVQAFRNKFAAGSLTNAMKAELFAIIEQYDLDLPTEITDNTFTELLLRVDVVPASLILAQAANESAWGTSRFAREGRNLFGIWCYKPGCGLKPKRRSVGSKHEVRVFDNVQEGIAFYIYNINIGHAYDHLRALRAASREEEEKPTGLELAAGLTRYSERGQAYVDEIRKMIRQNNLSRYLTNRANTQTD